MSDYCEYCERKGSLKRCELTECEVHESWYVKELIKLLSLKKAALDDALALIKVFSGWEK